MPQFLRRISAIIFTAIVFNLKAAPNRSTSIFAPPPLTASSTNSTVTIFWPVGKLPWDLVEQKPADKRDWKPMPATLYSTNQDIVSVTFPVAKQAANYKLKRNTSIRLAPTIAPPPLPEFITNQPPKAVR